MLFMMENMIYEVTLLSSSGLAWTNLSPIWYLSAMFLVFPLFTLMLSENDQFIVLCIITCAEDGQCKTSCFKQGNR